MSSESESDDDYVPEENPQKLSEEESADDETEQQYENELDQKAKKRKIAEESKGTKKRKTKNTRKKVVDVKEIEEEKEIEKNEDELDPEEQKKKEDELWAMFLDGTDTKPKAKDTTTKTSKEPTTTTSKEPTTTTSKEPTTTTNKESTSTAPPKPVASKTETKDKVDDAKEKEKRIFEFAGEMIVVEDNVIKERIKTSDKPATVSKLPTKPPSGGISGVLGALNKKNKLSVLEKSKLDWTTLKKEEGIEEEIKNHNKGKQGYLERRDFLERADLRQYEIERNLRMSRRSNR